MKQKFKNHLAIRWENITLCGKNGIYLNVYWADAYKRIKLDPDNRDIKFCQTCLKVKKKRKIKQLTAEECKKA